MRKRVETIKFSDFMQKTHKIDVLTPKEIEVFDTACLLLAIGLVAILLINLPMPMPLSPATSAFLQF